MNNKKIKKIIKMAIISLIRIKNKITNNNKFKEISLLLKVKIKNMLRMKLLKMYINKIIQRICKLIKQQKVLNKNNN